MNQKKNKNLSLEDQVLLHRYCYYVLSSPLLPDVEYDRLELEARNTYPLESVVHKVGSSLSSSYPDWIKDFMKDKEAYE